MKVIKHISLLAVMVTISCATVGRAQTNTPPTTPPVVVDPGKDNVRTELKEIKTLAAAFEVKRDAYLAQQKVLLGQLKNATADQRAAIRDELQANRVAFLADLKAFRQEIQDEVREIKSIIHNQELDRLLDPSKTTTPPRGHKGQGK